MTVSERKNNYTARLNNRKWLSKNTFEIHLTRPADFRFNPGQRIRVFHRGIERDYSLVSAPSDNRLILCIRKVRGGTMSTALSETDIYAELHISGPYGYFTYQPSERTTVLIATGTGIAPFCSMVRSGLKGFTLLHGVSSPEELYYRRELEAAAKVYMPCISKEARLCGVFFQGRVSDYLRKKFSINSYDFYLCGRSEMIREVTLLVDDLFPGSNIYTELFY
jgi:ferredoxin-NADP reductase